MQDLNVTLVQIDQVWENKKANLKKYEAIFENLEKTDLIVLPEMFQTGFSMNVKELSEFWEESEGISFLKMWAVKLNSAFYTSIIIEENNKHYNRGVFVFPNGSIEIYNKRKSFGLGGEDKFFTAGLNEKIVHYKSWKINLQICYDLRFPELIRNRIDENGDAAYDVIIYVANWPEKRSQHWKTLLKARAIENQCFVIGVNRVGKDDNQLNYSGDSNVTNPLGEDLIVSNPGNELVFKAVLSKKDLEEIRKTLPFLKDR